MIIFALTGLFFFAPLGFALDNESGIDLLIVSGSIVDGTGTPSYRGDIAIKHGRIIEIGNLKGRNAKEVLNADGLVAAPGFIDLHSHGEQEIREMPGADNYIHQGITTKLGGNCGGSPLPLGPYIKEVEDIGIAINLGILAGHNTLRRKVMGSVNREPTPEELAEMEAILNQAMLDGAFGMSTGLKYIPGAYSKTDEVVALAKIVSAHGGFYATHMRDEGSNLIAAVEETITIGREAGLPVHISHFKAMGNTMWGASETTTAMVDEARRNGIDVTADQYPYSAGSTGLRVVFPAWALAGGNKKIAQRLEDPETRAKIKADIIYNLNHDRGGGDTSRIVVATYPADKSLEGKNIAEIVKIRGMEPGVDSAAEVLMDLQTTRPGGKGIYHVMSEEDVVRIMRHPFVSVATDANVIKFGEAMPHPRNYGTYPRVLGRYVRERKILTLEEAVRKMTSLPADRMNLKDRGVLKKGMAADIVIFNPDTVIDRAEWTKPHQYPGGIPHVIVNGEAVIQNGERTLVYPGKVLRGPAYIDMPTSAN